MKDVRIIVTGGTIDKVHDPRSEGLAFSPDGEFNLGGAVIAAQILRPGVWGIMNGRIFPAETLNKNAEQGRFDL